MSKKVDLQEFDKDTLLKFFSLSKAEKAEVKKEIIVEEYERQWNKGLRRALIIGDLCRRFGYKNPQSVTRIINGY